jgi:hypothetical protein
MKELDVAISFLEPIVGKILYEELSQGPMTGDLIANSSALSTAISLKRIADALEKAGTWK